MRHYRRILNLNALLNKKTHFLFGARGTGKSTLIEDSLGKKAFRFDLLDDEMYQRLLRDPKIISQTAESHRLIVIDEIQRIPKLLHEVHRLHAKSKTRFLLTGSSARKLKHDSANLLAGRAWEAHLHPLTQFEIDDFDLLKYLNVGGLPHIYLSQFPNDELKNYINLYLREEVISEAFTRKIEYFLSFLDILAVNNGEELYYQGLSNDSGVPARTIQNYIEILEDTFLGFQLKPYLKTKKRKAIARSKFYLFDIGVTNFLAKRGNITEGGELYGKSFEHFIIREIRTLLSYSNSNSEMFYWRSTSQMEVDLVIGDDYAVEIKASSRVGESVLKGLKALREEGQIKNYVVVSNDIIERKIDGFQFLHWKTFLKTMAKHFSINFPKV